MKWLFVVALHLCSLSACSSNQGGTLPFPSNGTNNGNGTDDGIFAVPDVGSASDTAGAAQDAVDSASPPFIDILKPDNEGITGIDDEPDENCGYGSVFGVVCKKTAQMYVNGADVWIDTTDCDGNAVHISALSNNGGYYTLENVPNGAQVVHVKKDGFEYTRNIVIKTDKLTDITGVGHKECFKAVSSCELGNITGYVCAPGKTLYIGGADVSVETVDCNGQLVTISALSGADGVYKLSDVPSGPVVVNVSKGSFQTEYIVTVPPNGTVHAPDVVNDLCFPSGETKIAVVTGDWDHIESILDSLGLTYDLFDGDMVTAIAIGFLANLQQMNQYDIIFFDCGADHGSILASDPMIVSNIQQFVAAGGSVYASDWAYVYVEQAWPNAINFVGDPSPTAYPKVGNQGIIQGTIVDQNLATNLGKTAVQINYDLSAWVVVQSVPVTTTSHIVGNVPGFGNGLPLMMTHKQGAGTVLYTTFHNEQQVTNDMTTILNFLVFEL